MSRAVIGGLVGIVLLYNAATVACSPAPVSTPTPTPKPAAMATATATATATAMPMMDYIVYKVAPRDTLWEIYNKCCAGVVSRDEFTTDTVSVNKLKDKDTIMAGQLLRIRAAYLTSEYLEQWKKEGYSMEKIPLEDLLKSR